MLIDIPVPTTGGEYMDAVVVVEWHVKAGDPVTEGETIAVVETAKTAIEITAPTSGVISELLARPGEEVAVGATLGRITTEQSETPTPADTSDSAGQAETCAALQAATVVASAVSAPGASDRASTPAPAARSGGRVVASPAARRLAKSTGIDLSQVHPSSPTGRIKLRDLPKGAASAHPMLYLERRGGSHPTPLIFIHGFGGDRLGWAPLLGKLGPNTPVVLLELPNHGLSPAADSHSVEALAQQVAATLIAHGIDGGHVVGHSLGGAVAIELAASGSFRAASLALLAPAGLGPDVNGAFLEGFARAQSADSLLPWLRQLTSDGHLVDRSFAEFAMEQRADPELRKRQQNMGRRLFPDGTQGADLRSTLHALEMPVRIIWGQDDAIIPWRHALAGGWKAGLHLMPDVGHLPHIEAPDQVARILRELATSTGMALASSAVASHWKATPT